jgi:hypothetical protein
LICIFKPWLRFFSWRLPNNRISKRGLKHINRQSWATFYGEKISLSGEMRCLPIFRPGTKNDWRSSKTLRRYLTHAKAARSTERCSVHSFSKHGLV